MTQWPISEATGIDVHLVVKVTREKGGRPTIKLAGEAAHIADRLNVKNIVVSITHTADQAFAQVIFES